MSRAFVLLFLLAGAVAARADDDSAARAEAGVRERITRERAEVQAGFAQRQRECAERFAVTACIDAARSEQRAALARLRDQELGLDEAQRRQRAFERLSLIEEKKRGDAARAAAAASMPTSRAAAASPASAPAPAPADAAASRATTGAVKQKPARPVPTPRPVKSPKASADRSAQDARNREAFEARQQAAQARREAAQLRAAEREKQKQRAAGLPVPASGAAR